MTQKPVWTGKPANDANTMPDFSCPKCFKYNWVVFEKEGCDGHTYYGVTCNICDTWDEDVSEFNKWKVQRPGERWPRVWRLTKEAAMRFSNEGKWLDRANPTAEPTPPCSYSGCTETKTQMHHIAPRSIFEDADWYPVVPLCRAHHVAYHQRLDAWKAGQ